MAFTPLSKQDANVRIDTANTDQKRKRVVDLTLDSSEDEAPAKIQKGAAAINARRAGKQPACQRATPPASSRQAPRRIAPDGHESVYGPHPNSAIFNAHSQAELSSTQNAADQDELHRYGDLPTKIVGVQYYRGLASPGEYVLLLREPSNPYDANAIRVDNIAHQQIGHIPKRIAEKLAKYLDRGWLCIEGRLAGSIGTYDCPLEVNLLGPDPNSPAGLDLRTKMAADKLPTRALQEAEKREKERQKEHERQRKEKEKEEKKRLAEARRAAAAGGRGGAQNLANPNSQYTNQTVTGPSSQPIMEDLMEASQRFNPRAAGGATDQYGVQEEALANMPTTQQPAAIKTDMLPYQLQALRWMLDQEDPRLPRQGSKDSVQLWKTHDRQANAFVNIATNHPTATAPRLVSGGILADDMGLGKTLEVISLLIADAKKNGRGTTLVVAPLSVMSNWSGQIAYHIRADQALKVYTYHGSGRVKMKAADFQ
ncbi:hypothetical protein LTR86_000227 [Recurvomyces mirabilis]|nr:hypothetical protein LTR86_000227 [Recurvomyces mirabilis]